MEKCQRSAEDIATYGPLTEELMERRAKVRGLLALVSTTSDGKKRMEFVQRDFNATMNIRRGAVLEKRPPERTRKNFIGQHLKVDLYEKKLEPAVGGRSKKTGRRVCTSVGDAFARARSPPLLYTGGDGMQPRRRYRGHATINEERHRAAQFATAASGYVEEREAALREQCVVFQGKLQAFAREHRREIESDGALRTRFLELCMNLGVEPFLSRRSVWSQLLGLSEWYARLGFLVAQIALATRDWNGGVIRLTVLRRALQRRLDVDCGTQEPSEKRARIISNDDIARAVRTLERLRAGFRIISIDEGKKECCLVSGAAGEISFTEDEKAVLQRARATGGSICRQDLPWENIRWGRSIERLLQLGILWVDDGASDGQRRYWALGLIPESIEDQNPVSESGPSDRYEGRPITSVASKLP